MLNDPDELKKDSIPGGPSASLSSAQYLKGEAGQSPEFVKIRQENIKAWLSAQMAEKRLKEQAELQAGKVEAKINEDCNDLRDLVEHAQEAEARAAVLLNAEENRKLAAYRQARRQEKKQREIEFERKHAQTVVAYNSAREGHDHYLSPDGKKLDYKRCTMEQETQIWRENAGLVLAKKLADNNEEALDKMHMRVGRISEVLVDAAEDWNATQRRDERLRINEENRRLAQLKRESETFERQNYKSWAPVHLMSTFSSPRPGAPTF